MRAISFPQLNIESYRQFRSFHSRIILIRALQIDAAYDMTVITDQVRSKLQHRWGRVSVRLPGARVLKVLAHIHTDLGLLGLFKHFFAAVAGWECLRSRPYPFSFFCKALFERLTLSNLRFVGHSTRLVCRPQYPEDGQGCPEGSYHFFPKFEFGKI